MSDTISDMLRTAAKALREAVQSQRIEPRVYRDLGQTVTAIAETFEAEASARDLVDTVEYDPAVTTTTLDADIVQKVAEDFTAEQFNPAADFSIPIGDEPGAWLAAWNEAVTRAVGETPLAAAEITRYAFERYAEALRAHIVRAIAAQVGAVGIKTDREGDDRLADFVQLRDHIAHAIPKFPL